MERTLIQQDYYRIHGKWPGKFIFKGLINPNFRYMYFFRKAAAHKKKSIAGIFYRIILYRYQIKYGFQIYPETQIGGGLYLGHFGTVMINPKVVIGKNCNIAVGVAIGQTNRGEKKGCPIIGDNVWIGVNAVIFGKIKIGNNVLIGPNTYISEDVPDNSIVMPNRCSIISKEEATKGYVNNKV